MYTMTVTIPIDEYRELLVFKARADLLEEQRKQQEEELKAWREAHKEE